MADERILLFIPAYNCAAQIGRVVAQLTGVEAFFSEVMIVDNGSTDGTRAAAEQALARLAIRGTLYRNDGNYGLGGSHKVAFTRAVREGFDYLVVLHGDDQGSIADLVPHLRNGAHRRVDALLGARFMEGAQLQGYSRLRTLGNRIFNALYTGISGFVIRDLGSGLNLYRVKALESRFWLKCASDLTFNYHLLLRSVDAHWRMCFFPLTWREADQVSNVKLFKQARQVALLPMHYLLRRTDYLATDYSHDPHCTYASTMIFDNRAR